VNMVMNCQGLYNSANLLTTLVTIAVLRRTVLSVVLF